MFWIFWGLSLIGAVAIIPYQFEMIKKQIESNKKPGKKVPPLPVIKLISFLQTSILLGIASYFGVYFTGEINLNWPIIDYWLNGTVIPFNVTTALFLGLLLAFVATLTIIFLDLYFMKNVDTSNITIPSKKQSLAASLYGGISEEVLTRLFFMSFIVFLLQRLGLEVGAYWLGIITAAILFGILHLPTAINLFGKSMIVIIRTIMLNAIPGVIFGYLFWQYGIEIAMFSHFCADIFLHVLIGPLFHKKLYNT